jgi:hypothetical protein
MTIAEVEAVAVTYVSGLDKSRVRLERRNFAVQLPKLDIMAIQQLSRLFDCLVVVGAF